MPSGFMVYGKNRKQTSKNTRLCVIAPEKPPYTFWCLLCVKAHENNKYC